MLLLLLGTIKSKSWSRQYNKGFIPTHQNTSWVVFGMATSKGTSAVHAIVNTMVIQKHVYHYSTLCSREALLDERCYGAEGSLSSRVFTLCIPIRIPSDLANSW
jgi:hypothetical protein